MDAGHIVAVGHVGLAAHDVDRLATFYRETLGLHQTVSHPGIIAIYEVGDCDMFILPGTPGAAEFDLASDDVDALHRRLVGAGVDCGEPRDEKESGHRGFAFTDPDGNRLRVVSTHPRHKR